MKDTPLTINGVELDANTDTAIRLCTEFDQLKKRILAFVGQVGTAYDDETGIRTARKIASDGILKATAAVLLDEEF